MTVKRTIKEIIELAESKGWAHVNEVMKDEILQLALMIARQKEMTAQEIDFNRGAIWAAEQLLNLPEKLIRKLEGDLSLDEATSRQGRSERNDDGY
mgnify:CR=1 FL=1|jgi:hypothetical protein